MLLLLCKDVKRFTKEFASVTLLKLEKLVSNELSLKNKSK